MEMSDIKYVVYYPKIKKMTFADDALFSEEKKELVTFTPDDFGGVVLILDVLSFLLRKAWYEKSDLADKLGAKRDVMMIFEFVNEPPFPQRVFGPF
ncbi:hypothetical protein EPN15_02015 [Patescibacteria group bacterium]|nr:MAG: hypothetical protein EPN15_02015 [Patescibacteria group bacterium]